MKLKIAYFGSPQFSAFFLEKILTDEDLKKIISIEFIVTQPDKPVGRKQILTPTPVKQIALKYQVPIKSQTTNYINPKSQTLNSKQYQNSNNQNSKQKNFENLNLENSNLFRNSDLEFRVLKNLDIALVYAYSQIIPKELLDLPKYGFWCIHPSLLPKYRGPSPIAYTLLNGDKKTGITIFKMDEKIDHGPIIVQKSLTILPTDYRVDLEKKLTNLGFELFKKIIIKLVNSQNLLTLKHQNNNLATYTKILKKEDGYIKYETLKKLVNNKKINFEELPKLIQENLINSKSKTLNSNQSQIIKIQNSKEIKNYSKKIYDFFRALSPWPGVWTILPNGKRLKIIDMSPATSHQPPITKVQLEGKKSVDFQTFKKAYGFF